MGVHLYTRWSICMYKLGSIYIKVGLFACINWHLYTFCLYSTRQFCSWHINHSWINSKKGSNRTCMINLIYVYWLICKRTISQWSIILEFSTAWLNIICMDMYFQIPICPNEWAYIFTLHNWTFPTKATSENNLDANR